MSGEYHKPDAVIIDDPALRNLDLEAFDIGTMHDRTGPWVWSEVKGRHIWIGYLDGTEADDDAGTVTP